MSHDLDLLKKHWQEENHFKIYSEQELFIMTKKKSLSIARWLLIDWIHRATLLGRNQPLSTSRE